MKVLVATGQTQGTQSNRPVGAAVERRQNLQQVRCLPSRKTSDRR